MADEQDMNIKMRWIEHTGHWHMIRHEHPNHFLMMFPDCENIHKYFEGLHKKYVTEYTIDIKRVTDECKV